MAGKLGVTPFDLSDPVVMTDVRNELGFGRIHSYAISQPWQANQIEAKFNIARVLDVPDQLRRAVQGTYRAGGGPGDLSGRSPARVCAVRRSGRGAQRPHRDGASLAAGTADAAAAAGRRLEPRLLVGDPT